MISSRDQDHAYQSVSKNCKASASEILAEKVMASTSAFEKFRASLREISNSLIAMTAYFEFGTGILPIACSPMLPKYKYPLCSTTLAIWLKHCGDESCRLRTTLPLTSRPTANAKRWGLGCTN